MLDENNRPTRWEILETQQRVKDQFIDVRTDKCRASNGDIVDYHVLSYTNWVNMIALDAQGNIILVDEYRHGIGEAVVGLPGGALDKEKGIPSRDAAQSGAERELLEETGFTGKNTTLVLEAMANPAIQNNWVLTFICFDAKAIKEPSFDVGNGEFCVTVKRDFVELLSEISGHRLHMQAMHVAALWSAAHYIAKSKELPQSATGLQTKVRAFLLD